jgi:glucose dehydrogenase
MIDFAVYDSGLVAEVRVSELARARMAAEPIWTTLLLSTVAFLVARMALPAAAQNLPNNLLASARFSTLDEITVESVSNLELAFMVRLPVGCGYSGTPEVGGHTLLVLTPFPHQLYALELAAAAAGSVRWTYVPPANPAAHGQGARLFRQSWTDRMG